jgi:hypothetical protein
MRAAQTLRHLIGPLELIHEQAGPGLLRLTRLAIFALWIVKLLLDPLWRLAEMPRELFHPIGILALLPATAPDRLLTPGGLTAFLIVTLAVLALGLTNRAFPLVSTLAALLLTAYSCLIRGFGPAVHTDIVVLLAVYALAGFAWADWIAGAFFGNRRPPDDDAEDPRSEIAGYHQSRSKLQVIQSKRVKFGGKKIGAWNSYPLITIVAMLCLSYCLVGLNRTVAGGARVFTGDTMEAWTIDASLRGYYFNTNIGWHIPEWPLVVLMLRAGLPIVTLFEITAPLCLASSHYRWIFIPFMLSFHVLSLVLMNILFFDDMLLYLLLIDWSRRFPALRSPESRHAP